MQPVLVANVDLDARQQLAENKGVVCDTVYRAAKQGQRAVRGLFYS
jgi:hypothetical protein